MDENASQNQQSKHANDADSQCTDDENNKTVDEHASQVSNEDSDEDSTLSNTEHTEDYDAVHETDPFLPPPTIKAKAIKIAHSQVSPNYAPLMIKAMYSKHHQKLHMKSKQTIRQVQFR